MVCSIRWCKVAWRFYCCCMGSLVYEVRYTWLVCSSYSDQPPSLHLPALLTYPEPLYWKDVRTNMVSPLNFTVCLSPILNWCLLLKSARLWFKSLSYQMKCLHCGCNLVESMESRASPMARKEEETDCLTTVSWGKTNKPHSSAKHVFSS